MKVVFSYGRAFFMFIMEILLVFDIKMTLTKKISQN